MTALRALLGSVAACSAVDTGECLRRVRLDLPSSLSGVSIAVRVYAVRVYAVRASGVIARRDCENEMHDTSKN